jgi:signal transduction histidine kinase
VSLKRLGSYVASLGSADTDVALTDGRARLIASSARGGVGSLGTIRLPGAREGEAPSGPIVAEYVRDGRRLIGAFAPVTRWGMGALVDKTVDAALLPVNRITWATLIWIAVAAFIGSIAARIFARRLSDRVAALVVGSRRIGTGQLEARIEPTAPDELGELAAAFNQMATGLEQARQKITQQTDEIKAWNQTLEKRVEDKTTELRQAQDLLFRSRSLSALGELGAGVAHEINNPLTGALGIVQLLIADLPAGHPARPLLQDLESEALRIRKIVQNMLRLAQRQSGHDTTPVDLARTLDDAVELCGPSDMAAAGIAVVRKYGATPSVRGSATQLQESFIQIIQNARSAMKKGGTLTLETSQIEDKVVRVRIGDSGTGISAEHLPRIFDPFFTTKGDRSGTGLGLSFVHRTVEDHGGTVTVDSSVGGGTTFTLTFPADEGRAHRP